MSAGETERGPAKPSGLLLNQVPLRDQAAGRPGKNNSLYLYVTSAKSFSRSRGAERATHA